MASAAARADARLNNDPAVVVIRGRDERFRFARRREINLDEFEQRLRAAGAPAGAGRGSPCGTGRLVEFSHTGDRDRRAAGERAAPIPPLRARLLSRRCEKRRSAADARRRGRGDRSRRLGGRARGAAGLRVRRASSARRFRGPSRPAAARSKRWMVAVSALAIAGVAMIGAVFALKRRRCRASRSAPVHRRGPGTDQGCSRRATHSVAASERRRRIAVEGQHASRRRSRSSTPRSSRSI